MTTSARRAASFVCALAVALTGVPTAGAQPLTPELETLLESARLTRRVAAWCRGEFRSAGGQAYAVAVRSDRPGGRYLVIELDGTAIELAPFADQPDIACYTAQAARALGRTIAETATLQGALTVPETTPVICGFLEITHAVCWQYSTGAGAFVKIGEWIT